MSDAFNKCFLSVFTKERWDIVPDCGPIFSGDEESSPSSINISKVKVVKQIERLKATKSPGPNENFPRVLKECEFEICDQLTEIFNKSVDTGFVPIAWGQANVVLVFKKGDKLSIYNYSPISVTSVIGKTLESIIVDRLRDYLET